MDPETIARTIAYRQVQIEQLSTQLLESLKKVDGLEKECQELVGEKLELIRKLERKSISIKQETEDIALLKSKITNFNKKTWGDTFWSMKSWVGSKLPYKSS